MKKANYLNQRKAQRIRLNRFSRLGRFNRLNPLIVQSGAFSQRH